MNNLNKYTELLKQVKHEHNNSADLELNSKVLIIDGLNTFIRVWSVVPQLNEEGVHVGGITGFLKSVGSVVRQFRPTRVIVVFDGSGGSKRRKKLYPAYKEGRSYKFKVNRPAHMNFPEQEPDNMKFQLRRLADYLGTLPLTVIREDNVEADDVMAYLGTHIFKDSKITYLSSDKDFLQLVDERSQVWAPTKKQLCTKDNVHVHYEAPSHNFLMYRLFLGDNSDNINGIDGVGKKGIKTKLPLIFEDKKIKIGDILQYCQDRAETNKKGKGNIYQKILDQKDTLYRNYDLMQLHNVDIDGSIKLRVKAQADKIPMKLDKKAFIGHFNTDQMYSAIPNVTSWFTSTWEPLNAYLAK